MPQMLQIKYGSRKCKHLFAFCKHLFAFACQNPYNSVLLYRIKMNIYDFKTLCDDNC